ncbi:MAG TPA: FAD-dependent oxidoreductase [Alphaproteobacteria bacterium]|jgi:2-polyprenyl-6-methoxyphenol hydroxylase-like FAD-dependent oxidoreductase
MEEAKRQCVIAGGGPAGMMLGFLLARAGIAVTVLEKHADFLRDFRGDTIHPSTLQLMRELGLLDAFLKLPHQKAYELHGRVGSDAIKIADFRHLPNGIGYIAFMPQWDFLDFLADEGRGSPHFDLRMKAEATSLIEEGGRVVGLRVKTPDGESELRADLVVAADGRGSVLRELAGLKVVDQGAPMDVLWFNMPRLASDPGDVMGVFDAGRIVVLINRGDYWQCAFVIKKDSHAELQAHGLKPVQDALLKAAPFLGERVRTLASWDQLKLLVVKVDRLEQWHKPGLLCIGDAAHAMSPVGGVGINLAIQDAVAAANILWRPLRERRVGGRDLAAVQSRRLFPTRVVQRMQVFVQRNLIASLLGSRDASIRAPWILRLLTRLPLLQRIPARIVGLGVRPEHIHSPALPPAP